jgi:hypothetical protein
MIKAFKRVGSTQDILVEQQDGTLALMSKSVAYENGATVYDLASSNAYSASGGLTWLDAGEFLGVFTEAGFVPETEKEGEKEVENTFQELYDSLSKGEKQHMANKLFKDDGVVPQKLAGYVPDHMRPPEPLRFKKGDLVEVWYDDEYTNQLKAGTLGVVAEVDPVCEGKLFYLVQTNTEQEGEWAREDQLREYLV